ncbi:hypothetical protein BDD43_2470 [Mucilaginibacter gracilis]|uniref:Uncharacterized protein n=1 Tax=Mucilaginibacter gracilis TaxID=423350 RepID=A0A495J1X1_9SPHI|nr:hypothetical protein [Mucilaginibacter gracilis]RKR82294.1 hypothetical protein BDD43_2470 [Mucilaginibacter gracilis]
MKLTAQQINHIKLFIAKRGFTYPDVQLEIIDHVASRVEELMTESPELNLDEAIGITHAEFGVMGFSVFEDALINSLQQKYFKLFKTIFLSYLNWKYLPAMAAFIYLFYRTYVAINNPQGFVTAGLIGFFIALVITGTRYELKYKKYSKLLTMRMGNFYLVICCVLFNLWNVLGNSFKLYRLVSTGQSGIIFGVMVVFVVLLFITVNKLRKIAIKNCKELDEKYHLISGL